MLELTRGLSQQSTDGSKNAVIFFFNTGDKESLDSSHSFITQVIRIYSHIRYIDNCATTLVSNIDQLFDICMQNPWNKTTRAAVDCQALGLGGKSSIFQV